MNNKWYVSWLDMLEKREWLFLMTPFFQGIEDGSTVGKDDIYNTLVNSQGALEAQKKMQEDTRWADSTFVLVAYKTEPCKRAARLCRQGYACPNYHNNKDRRRSPKLHSYRSTPCPLVKSHDEWGDPSVCDNQDNCQYCHTRTEQQFHPEIYKSTRCKDMQQYLFCPRGPFCAFAHDDNEAQIVYDIKDAQYPDTTSPPTTTSGIIGDKRGRSYTHSGLALEARARSGSNDSRIRSLSLIESMQTMHLGGTPPALLGDRNRTLSQGSDNSPAHSSSLIPPDPRDNNSPRVQAVLTESAKLAAAVPQFEEHPPFYNSPELASVANGHYAGVPPTTTEFNASHATFPTTEQASDYMMMNGLSSLLSSTERRIKVEQAVLDNARIIQQQQQHQEQQRALINDSLDALKAINKLTSSLFFNAQKLPVNMLVHLRQQFTKNLEDVNSLIAVRKQMACIVCQDRVRDAFIQPCCHYVSCQDCLKSHKYCPACNEVIQRIYNVCI